MLAWLRTSVLPRWELEEIFLDYLGLLEGFFVHGLQTWRGYWVVFFCANHSCTSCGLSIISSDGESMFFR